jgi:hypothetical protein
MNRRSRAVPVRTRPGSLSLSSASSPARHLPLTINSSTPAASPSQILPASRSRAPDPRHAHKGREEPTKPRHQVSIRSIHGCPATPASRDLASLYKPPTVPAFLLVVPNLLGHYPRAEFDSIRVCIGCWSVCQSPPSFTGSTRGGCFCLGGGLDPDGPWVGDLVLLLRSRIPSLRLVVLVRSACVLLGMAQSADGADRLWTLGMRWAHGIVFGYYQD